MTPWLPHRGPRARYLDAVLSLQFARGRLNADPSNPTLQRDRRNWVRFALAYRRAALLGAMPALAFEEDGG